MTTNRLGQRFKLLLSISLLGLGSASFSQAAEPIRLDLPAPPTPSSTITNNANGDIDRFAWNTFIALNWPALHRSETTSSNAVRGVPNTDVTFALASPESRTVWETFKEKREVFNIGTYNTNTMVFSPTLNRSTDEWFQRPSYGPYRPANQETVQPQSGLQHPSVSKLLIPSFKFPYNALDETIEVKSEGLETNEVTLNKVVAPRVWLHNTTNNVNTPVLYEVKLNKDVFDYVINHELYVDETLRAKANGIRLPYRTSFPSLSPGMGNTASTTNYTAEAAAKEYRLINQTLKTNASAKLPPIPGIGSVHMKAAWIKLADKLLANLTAAERTALAVDTYHVADATYYVTDTQTQQPVPQEGLFGLIGLHIIQRVHFGNQALGGTFVFATWEHDSVSPGNNPPSREYRYSNWFDPGQNGMGFSTNKAGFYPPVASAYPVKRRPGAIPATTSNATYQAHQKIKAALASANPPQTDSHWLHYKLVGTQYVAYDTNQQNPEGSDVKFSDPPSKWEKDNGQNNYLANLAIETNYGLQAFRGLPPLFQKTNIVDRYISAGITGHTNSAAVFARFKPNTAQGVAGSPAAHNMGECMGCHGVAQIQGYNFSFVLLAGNDGAKTDTTTHFDLPPGKAPTD